MATITVPTVSESPMETIQKITGIEPENIQFFNTPYFRKYYHETREALNSDQNYNRVILFHDFHNYVNNIAKISSIWENVPNDHFQTHREELMATCMFPNNVTAISGWFRTHVDYASFFNMIQQYLKKNSISELNTNLNDTVNQLTKLLQRKVDVRSKDENGKPNYRWRLTEFHDYISYEYVKHNTKNVEHTNTLIPEEYTQGAYRVFQPKDTVALTVWGQRVKNCIASYEDGILSNQHHVILITKNDTPLWTAQISHIANPKKSDMRVNIMQIKAQCNSNLSQQDQNQAQSLIEAAIRHYHRE